MEKAEQNVSPPTVRAMTAAQKMFARACNRDWVTPGEVVYPNPEMLIIHDGFVETAYKELSGLGYGQITSPEKVVFVTDHEVSYSTPRAVERGRNIIWMTFHLCCKIE